MTDCQVDGGSDNVEAGRREGRVKDGSLVSASECPGG